MSGGWDQVREHPARVGLAQVNAGLDRMAEANLWSLSGEELLALRADLERVNARLAAGTLAATREVAASGAGVAAGAASAAGWLRGACRVDPRAATREVALASALDGRLAATGAALAGGDISVAHATVIRDSVDGLPPAVAPAVRRDAEAFLLVQAGRFDPQALARLGKHLLHVVDPDGAKALEADEAEQQRNQSFSLGHRHDGSRVPRGSFAPEGGALLDEALDAVSAPRPGADGAPDPRSPGQRRAEGLLELARMALACPEMPEHGGEPVTVVTTIPLATLQAPPGQSGTQAGQLADGTAISAEASRRLACDAFLIPAVLGTTGEVLDIGRMSRVVPRPMRRALVVRDRGCAFPGCGRPPKWCHAHHIVHWAHGGPTSIDNLVLLCGHHHRVIHHDGWSVHIGPDGQPVFTPPRWIDPEQLPRPGNNAMWRQALHDQPLLT